MTACEGQGCPTRETCRRYTQRAHADLVARVMCRLPDMPWRIAA